MSTGRTADVQGAIRFMADRGHDGGVAPRSHDDAGAAEETHEGGFRTYISRVPAPAVKRGDIVVMDNVPLHRTCGVREALEGLGVTVPEFPAYSPDLNPIEQPIGKLKAFLHKLGPRSWRGLMLAVRKWTEAVPPPPDALHVCATRGIINLNGRRSNWPQHHGIDGQALSYPERKRSCTMLESSRRRLSCSFRRWRPDFC
jgi:hypothetical protein